MQFLDCYTSDIRCSKMFPPDSLPWNLSPWAPVLPSVKTGDNYTFPKLSGQGSDKTVLTSAEDNVFSQVNHNSYTMASREQLLYVLSGLLNYNRSLMVLQQTNQTSCTSIAWWHYQNPQRWDILVAVFLVWMNENIQSKELKTSELCMILWKHESQNISFSCPKQSETEDILSKYLSQLYTFGQLDLYTKMREVFGEVFLFFLIFFFSQTVNILTIIYNSY